MAAQSVAGIAPATGGTIELAAGRTAERDRASWIAGTAALAAALLAGWLLALGAAGTWFLAPRSRVSLPTALHGPLAGSEFALSAGACVLLLAIMLAGYVVALRCAPALNPRAALTVVVALHVAFLLAPPMISSDIFSYVSYARMGALHGLNPYLHGPLAIAGDPSFPFVGQRWISVPTVYGPLFTIGSYVLAPLGLAASVWALKLLAAFASLACVGLVWRCALRRGLDPLKAALLFGLNPLVLVWGVGGGHNDLLMALLALGGIALALEGRTGRAGAALVGAVAVKLTAGLALPFLVMSRDADRRRRALAGVAAAVAAVALLALTVLGTAPLQILSSISRSQHAGDWHSFPGFVLKNAFGSAHPSTALLDALTVTLALICAALLVRTWRRDGDWIAAAAWGMVAVLLTSANLQPWYIVWLLPFAALGRHPRLPAVAVGLTTAILAIRLLDFLPAHVHSLGPIQ
jgi:uncharacterized membrane protein